MTSSEVLAGISLMRYYLHEYNRLTIGDFGKEAPNIADDLFREIKNNPKKWQKEAGYICQTARSRFIDRLKNKGKKEAFELLIKNRYLIKENRTDSVGREQQRYRINPAVM